MAINLYLKQNRYLKRKQKKPYLRGKKKIRRVRIPVMKQKEKKENNEKTTVILERLKDLESKDVVYSRWTPSIEDIDNTSFEGYERIIHDDITDEDLAFGLYKAGLLPDEIESREAYEWEDYTSQLREKAEQGDMGSQKQILTAYLWNNNEIDKKYKISIRKIDDKDQVGLEANGVNVTYHGSSGGVPVGIRYISYISGDIQGDNLQNDGLILKIDDIIATYDRRKRAFVIFNQEKFIELEKDCPEK